LIEKPKMQEKLLQKPPPKYIYDIIINTMGATEFPRGLFTEEELDPKYFDSDPKNKMSILQKAIDITMIVLNEKLEIKTKNILKGEEPEKTNLFLQALHRAATSGKDFPKYIKKYQDHKKKKEEEEDKKKKEEEDKKKNEEDDKIRKNDEDQKKKKVADKPKTKKVEEPPAEPKTNPTVTVEANVAKPARPMSSVKRPQKVKDDVQEINDNTQQTGGSKPVGIISDKDKEEDEEGGEKPKDEEAQEEPAAEPKTGIKFSTKLRPGAKDDKKARPAVNVADLESIKNYVQEISRNANPIGKILDFLPDDIESMNKELNHWIKEQKVLKDKYDEEVKKSDEILQPLYNELMEMEESVRDEEVKIRSIKYRIIKNEQLITDLINGVISIKNNK